MKHIRPKFWNKICVWKRWTEDRRDWKVKKVELFRCHKGVLRIRSTELLILNFRRQMGTSDNAHIQAVYSREQKPWYTFNTRLSWSQTRSGCFELINTSFFASSQTIIRPSSSPQLGPCIYYAILYYWKEQQKWNWHKNNVPRIKLI